MLCVRACMVPHVKCIAQEASLLPGEMGGLRRDAASTARPMCLLMPCACLSWLRPMRPATAAAPQLWGKRCATMQSSDA